MASKNVWVFLVTALALALVVLTSVNAGVTTVQNRFVTVTAVELDGVDILKESTRVAQFSGDTIPLRIQFRADKLPSGSGSIEDVRVKAWISGGRENTAVSERFDVIADKSYNRHLVIPIPTDLDDDEKQLQYILNIVIESRQKGELASVVEKITVQRESYQLDILDVEFDSNVKAGSNLAIDVVLKNIGRQLADDAFVRVSIPALGVEDRAYFGDLSAVDQTKPRRENTNERRLSVRIPRDTPAGSYNVEIEAFNEDSIALMTKKLTVRAADELISVIPATTSKTFAAGSEEDYSLTIVNRGNTVEVYEIMLDSPTDLNVEVDESVFAVPAGTSKTVKFVASSNKEGRYNFNVDVRSDGKLVAEETFSANVEGRSRAIQGNVTVLLTVILAIVFVVLLVVLIVLLTRRPEKSEEFGESYY